MLTVRHHVRSARDLGVPIFAHRSGLHEFEGGDVKVEGYDALACGDGVVNYGELGHPPDQFLGDDPAG